MKVATVLAIFLASCGQTSDAEVYVQCQGSPGGMACTVERRAGTQRVEASWVIKIGCRNGFVSEAFGAHMVPDGVGAKSSRLVTWDKFYTPERCDDAVSIEVVNVRLAEKQL